MMYFLMYLLTIIDNITNVAEVFVYASVVGFIVGLFGFIISKAEKEEDVAYMFNRLRRCSAIALATSCFLYVFTPSQKGLAFVFIAPSIIENGHVKETVKNIPELTQLGTEYLKEILQEKVKEVVNEK